MLTTYKTLLQNPVYIRVLPFDTVMISTEQKSSPQNSWPSTNISQNFVRENLSYDGKLQQVSKGISRKIVEIGNVSVELNDRINLS